MRGAVTVLNIPLPQAVLAGLLALLVTNLLPLQLVRPLLILPLVRFGIALFPILDSGLPEADILVGPLVCPLAAIVVVHCAKASQKAVCQS